MRKYLFVCSLLLCTVGCSRNKEIALSNIHTVQITEQWAKVNVPYTAIYKEPSFSARVVSHARKGDVLKPIGNFIEKTDEFSRIWYKFENGWLPEDVLLLYENWYQTQ